MSDGTAAANRKAAVAEPADEAGEKKPSASELCEEGSDDASEAGEAGDGGDRDSRSKQTVVTHNERWEDAFSRLRAFQRRHGHCEVPFRYAPDTRLGRWGALLSDGPSARLSLLPRPPANLTPETLQLPFNAPCTGECERGKETLFLSPKTVFGDSNPSGLSGAYVAASSRLGNSDLTTLSTSG
jgi:Helicase associated domain